MHQIRFKFVTNQFVPVNYYFFCRINDYIAEIVEIIVEILGCNQKLNVTKIGLNK